MTRLIKNIQNKAKLDLRGLPLEHTLPVSGLSHIVGQAAALRFFDENSRDDFKAMNEILTHKQIKHWMDDVGKLSWSDYKYWAGNHSRQSFLFSVHDSRLENPDEVKKIRGFVNIYSERGEKFRVKRMAKLGLIRESTDKHFLEFSMALRLFKNGLLSGSGLMSSALRQSCLQVKALLNLAKTSDLVIFGFIDPKNINSVRAIQASGFVKKGKAKYDSTSDEASDIYILSWRKLQKIVEERMEKALRNKMKIIMEPQITDSHCGPAVIKALLQFNGIITTQDQIVEAAKVKSTIMKKGMRPKQIADAVEKLDSKMKFWFKQNASIRDLDKLIHTYKIPVGINWQGLFYKSADEERAKYKKEDRGHYSIVIDVDKKKKEIILDDPYREYFEVPRVFSYEWFKSRWFDADEVVDKKTKKKSIVKTNKFIFIVTPKNTEFPKDLGMKDINELVMLESFEINKNSVVI